jgi:polyhydroxyalkanoate synthesis regulator phasin
MNKQKITIGLTILTLLTTTLFVAKPAFADSSATTNKPNFFQGLVTFIEQKFGLNKDQVTAAVNQYKNQVKANTTPRPTQTPAQIQAMEKTRLDKLVSSGKITSDQEKAIINELALLNTKYNLSSLTGTQRKTQMQVMQAELKTWAASQSPSINLTDIMPFGGPREGMGGRGFKGQWGQKPTATPTP